jgi:hypothetical protein
MAIPQLPRVTISRFVVGTEGSDGSRLDYCDNRIGVCFNEDGLWKSVRSPYSAHQAHLSFNIIYIINLT